MRITHGEHTYNVLVLAIFPALAAAALVLLVGRMRGVGSDWLSAGMLAALVYGATVSGGLIDLLATANRQHQAERARALAIKVAYQVFTNSEARLPYVGKDVMPGMRRRSYRLRSKGKDRVVVFFEPEDPSEQARRDALVQTVYWAWAAESAAPGKRGLTVEALVGPDKAFSHPSEWTRAMDDLMAVGVVSKVNGVPTIWAPNWGPEKAIAFIESGVPLPLDYKERPARVRPWAASQAPRPSLPPAGGTSIATQEKV